MRYLLSIMIGILWAMSILPAISMGAELKNPSANVVKSGFHKDYETMEVPVLKVKLRYGDVIGKSDIKMVEIAEVKVRSNVIIDAKELIGKTPRRYVGANKIIRHQDITAPIAVKRGDMVNLVYRSKNLEVRTIGEALDSGSKGDAIRVQNIKSKKLVQAVVIEPGVAMASTSKHYLASK